MGVVFPKYNQMDKPTIFQGLQQFFKKNDTYAQTDEFESYDMDFMDKQLVKTPSRAEFERVKLQKQQLKHIQSQWSKINNVVARNTLMYEAQRLPAYFDYDIMSKHDVIGKALEIFTEESCTPNEKGRILTVFSESKRVQKELENLFYNRLNLHTNLPMWIFETLKNGDCFVHLNLHDEDGVIGCRQLPTIEIERLDANYLGKYFSGNHHLKNETIFRWKGEHIVEFRAWQVAHFRMLLDQTCLPYGVSILKNIRRLYQNIILTEDALLSEQILRGVDRLIFYIDTGAIDPDDVPSYLQEVMSRIKRKKHVDKVTGQIDLKAHVMSIDTDYVIPKRGAADSSKIEKIEGKKQLDTGLIDYLMKKLIATLGVPKSFLNYDESVGDGKNLSMLDIRFARTVNRIQQSILMTLNQIAIVHLFIKDMIEDVDDFRLVLNNPSIQTEVLRVDLLQNKINLYRDMTDVGATGIAAMSNTKAKKEILGMTDDEIMLDIKQQRIERAIATELESTAGKIPYTGIFKDIDTIYGDPSVDAASLGGGDEGDGELGGSGGGSGGGGGGGLSGLGGEGDLSGEGEGEGDPIGDKGGTGDNGGDIELGDKPDTDLGEGFNIEEFVDNLILEHQNKKNKKTK